MRRMLQKQVMNPRNLDLITASNVRRYWKDLQILSFQSVKRRKADFRDAGSGVAVSNTDAKFRDAELAIIQN